MPPIMKAEERRKKSQQAYQRWIKRESYASIARELDISRYLVSRMVTEEREQLAMDRENSAEREKAISTYEAVIRAAWARFDKLPEDSRAQNAVGYLNSITAAQKAIAELQGLDSIDAEERAFETMLGVLEEKLAPHIFRETLAALAEATGEDSSGQASYYLQSR